MDKSNLISQIVIQIESDLTALRAAALETYAAATGDESKPENKYDTRALEASYLAGAQAKRVLDLEDSIGIYRTIVLKSFDETSRIESTALVEVELLEASSGKKIWVFIIPAKGSLSLKFAGLSIQVITPQSPLGEALLGLKVGDVAKVERGDRQLEYEIISVR